MDDKNLYNAKNITGLTSHGQKIIVNSSFVRENLPLPFVLYPDHYGTFIGFSKKIGGKIYFCDCSQTAIINYFRFLKNEPSMLIQLDFPPSVFPYNHNQNWSKVLFPEFVGQINFKKGICHKCNFAVSTITALHPMYGGRFKQSYNWYINQQYFHLGIRQETLIEDVCPTEIVNLLEKWRKAADHTQAEHDKLLTLFNSPKRLDIAQDEPQYMKNVKMSEAEVYRQLQRTSNSLRLNFTNYIENLVRTDFGYRKIGEGWISESILFKIVSKIFTDTEVIRHHRPRWLNGLELDIYIPARKIGFEYQGKQHYFPVKAWGGEKSLKGVQQRDKKKRSLCEELGIKLIIIKYSDPLTEEFVQSALLDLTL